MKGTENSQEVAMMKYDDRERETGLEGRTHESGRRALLTGAASAVLLVAALAVLGEPPSSEESVQDVVAFYSEHGSEATGSAMLSALGGVLFLFFVGGLGSVLQRSEGPAASLAAVVRAGGAVAAVGMLILAGLSFTLGEASAHLEPAAVQTLNALSDNFFFPLVGGMTTFLVAAGLAIVRSRPLPQWLGWLALVVGVAVFTPLGPLGFLAAMAWVLVASIVLATGSTTSLMSAARRGAER